MNRLPAGLLAVTLWLSPFAPAGAAADESAQQLADQSLGAATPAPDASAADLAKQQGLDDGNPGTDPEESAAQLAADQGVEAAAPADESAATLATETGVEAGAAPDDSAAKLAEKAGLEAKPKIVGSATGSVFSGGEGINGSVFAVAAFPDGSVVVGGRFNAVNGQPRSNLARIKADGSLDGSFLGAPNDGVSGAVYALALDTAGNLLVGGYFTTAQGQPAQNFVRYLANGTLDPAIGEGQSPNGAVYALAVQANGKIVIGGEFSQVGPTPRRNVARFNADGSLDGPVTAADTSTGTVRALTALRTGPVLVGGTFEIAGQDAKNLLKAE